MSGKDLKAGRPPDFRQPLTDRLLRNLPAPPSQGFDNGQGGGRIVKLIFSKKAKTQGFICRNGYILRGRSRVMKKAEGLTLKSLFNQLDPAVTCYMKRASFFLTDAPHHIHHLCCVLITHNIRAGFDDPALVAGNLRQGIAQIFRVLQPDIGDNSHFRCVNDIRGVKNTAQTHFQHDNIAVFFCKIKQADRRDDLKLTRMVLHGIRRVAHTRRDPAQRFFRDILAADLDPLPEIFNIWGRIKTGHITRLPQDPLHHGTGAALAVAARHMDETQLLLRIAQKPQQFLRPGQPQLPLTPGMCVDILNCFCYRHQNAPPCTGNSEGSTVCGSDESLGTVLTDSLHAMSQSEPSPLTHRNRPCQLVLNSPVSLSNQ